MLRRLLSAALGATLLLVGVVALSLAVAPTPASAHAQLLTATPESGEVLAASPAEVGLTFNEDLLDLGTQVLVVDAETTDHAAGPAAVDGDTVTAAVGDLPAGHYQVRWRVISADGHPISGAVPFTVGDVPDDAPSPTAAAVPAEDTAPTPPAEPAVAGAGVDAGAAPATGWPRVLLVGGLGAVLALALLAGGVALGRRTRTPSHDSRKQDPT